MNVTVQIPDDLAKPASRRFTATPGVPAKGF